MPRNKKESVIFTLMMTGMMVIGMSGYNLVRHFGFNANFFAHFAVGFLPTLAVAFSVSYFIANRVAKTVAFRLPYNKKGGWRISATMSVAMIAQMVLLMSLYYCRVGFWRGLLGTLRSDDSREYYCCRPATAACRRPSISGYAGKNPEACGRTARA